jgi:hypothetical protein
MSPPSRATAGRTRASMISFKLLHDAGGVAFIDDVRFVGFISRRGGVAKHRTARREMIHDRRQHVRL